MTVSVRKRLAFQSVSVALQTANSRMLRSRKAGNSGIFSHESESCFIADYKNRATMNDGFSGEMIALSSGDGPTVHSDALKCSKVPRRRFGTYWPPRPFPFASVANFAVGTGVRGRSRGSVQRHGTSFRDPCCERGVSWLDNYFKMPTCRRPRCQ
jgi:hypothetical protein